MVATWLMAACVSAQTAGGPPGAVRGWFGSDGPQSTARSTQQFSTWVDFSGGYDRNRAVTAPDVDGDSEGRATTLLGGMRYWRGRSTRSLEANARLFRNEARAGGTTAVGGEVSLNGSAALGRRGGLSTLLRAASDSAVLFGALTPALPTETPDAGIVEAEGGVEAGDLGNRWFSASASTEGYLNWTSRNRSTVQAVEVRRRPGSDNQGLDSRQSVISLRQDWSFRPGGALIGNYRFERVAQSSAATAELEPVLTHTAEGGVRFERRFSPVRMWTTSITAGATALAGSGDGEASRVEPSGSFTTSYTLTRRWLLVGIANRSITVLQGVAQIPFTNELASLSLSGQLGRRLTIGITGAVSRGEAVSGGAGAFDAVGANGTIRYGFRYGGLFVGYTQYEHRLRRVVAAPGISPRFEQRALRAGVTLWLPLYGAF